MDLLKMLTLFLVMTACSEEEISPSVPSDVSMLSYDGTFSADFGTIDYRVYYKKEYSSVCNVIHVSRGGNGNGDDRGELLAYVEMLVSEGYVVVQVDHRFAGSDIVNIARFRGEEIQVISESIARGTFDFGTFTGAIDGSQQGFIGHSAGCMEGLMAAGTDMTHGDYLAPAIKAVYGMSPVGFAPDQYGISGVGFSAIDQAAIFVVVGEEEKDINGARSFMATDWRLQAYDAMNENAPRFQAFVRGSNTKHPDIPITNPAIKQYNLDNAKAFFERYVRGKVVENQIGQISLPSTNPIDFQKKGLQ